ncbi:MAG: hypothetical protein NZ744_04950, partial [Pirellulaceae bacterium]|nr:hypothetical protein [Pirellulaceae bacterium]
AAGKIDFVMVNAFTDRIYMGTRSGLIQCIHETHREFPMLHVDEVVTTDDAAEGDNNDNPMNPVNPMPQAPVAPPAANPFGGGVKPPAANPFGGGAAKPPAANNNPFK